MALPHAGSGQLIDVRPLGDQLATTPSKALLKARDLEVMRLVLHADKPFPEHQVKGEATILCLEGSVELHAHGSVQVMQQGEMVYLRGGEPHALRAVGDASVLVTIALKNDD